MPDFVGFDAYRGGGGYRLLQSCLAGERRRDEVIEALEHSGLRGLGGAGFPTGRKWRLVRQEPAPRLMAVNADEGEPGTFKDRWFLETDPHRMIEGMLIAAWVVEAEEIYVYLRDEYPQCRAILEGEIAAARRGGAGAATCAFICAAVPAPISAARNWRCSKASKASAACRASARRSRRRSGCSAGRRLCNNVETLYWVRDIVEKGADWFTGHGRNGRKGLRTFSVSGRVREPGVKLAPAGITARQLIDEFCGGMADGHAFKGYLPGGASGGILPAALADMPLDFGTLEHYGCFTGSGAVVVLSDRDDMKRVALNLLRFFEDESCGQCTPCRAGTEQAVRLMAAPHWDERLLQELTRVMSDASICGLGQAAMNPVTQVLKHFREDLTTRDLPPTTTVIPAKAEAEAGIRAGGA